jgi:hypothetical protein
MVDEQKATMADAENLEKGNRATWDERRKLCVAKLGPQLAPNMTLQDFPGLLLEQGATTRDDRFVELHIWGPMTIRSVQSVRVERRRNRPLKAQIGDLRNQLKKYSISVVEA